MAINDFYSDNNFHLGINSNVVLEMKSSNPTSYLAVGRVIFVGVAGMMIPKYWDGFKWVTMLSGSGTSGAPDVTASPPLVATVSGSNVNISIPQATATKDGYYQQDHWSKVDDIINHGSAAISDDNSGRTNISGANVFASLNSVDLWISSHLSASNPHGVGMSELSDYNANNNKIINVVDPTSNQDAATKKYVDAQVAAGARPPKVIHPGGSNVPYPPCYLNYPTCGGTNDIMEGDRFIIGEAGTIGPNLIAVGPNDTVIAKKDAPNNDDNDWEVIVATVSVPNATTSHRGIIEIATQAEVDAGTDTERAVTPATLHGAIQGSYVQVLHKNATSPSDTSITLIHNWNNKNVIAQAYENNTDKMIFCEIQANANNVIATVNSSPDSTNGWRLVIMGIDL